MYAKGISTRDIEKHLENLYGVDAFPEFISRITDKIIPLITKWQNRPLSALEDLEEKWAKKYPTAVKSWKNNWPELSTYFKYPEELRRIIYTTNSVENYHRSLRKVTKAKSSFVNDMALTKILYLATVGVTKKWSECMREWPIIYSQINIYFEERIATYAV